MSDLEQRFYEDRAMRDAARTVLLADLEHARASFSAKGIADRVGGRIGDGAKDVLEVAKEQADDNRGILAAIIGAILLWIAREPLLEILGLSGDSDGANGETGELTGEAVQDEDHTIDRAANPYDAADNDTSGEHHEQ